MEIKEKKEIFDRTSRLITAEGLDILGKAKVLVFGLGGVGSYVCESLARSGIGEIGIVDRDVVALSNINRQIIALYSTVGKKKTDVMKTRLLDINPDIKINDYFISYDKSSEKMIDFSYYDFVVDAIDSIDSKILIAQNAARVGIKIISCMATGFRLDPTRFRFSDIYKTSGCPLAKVMRKELRKAGIEKLKVLFSDEKLICNGLSVCSIKNSVSTEEEKSGVIKIGCEDDIDCDNIEITGFGDNSDTINSVSSSSKILNENDCNRIDINNDQIQKQKIIASISFVPSVAGLLISGEVVREIIKQK